MRTLSDTEPLTEAQLDRDRQSGTWHVGCVASYHFIRNVRHTPEGIVGVEFLPNSMSKLTRRRFCEIALAAPVIGVRAFRASNVTPENLKRIEQVENSLVEFFNKLRDAEQFCRLKFVIRNGKPSR